MKNTAIKKHIILIFSLTTSFANSAQKCIVKDKNVKLYYLNGVNNSKIEYQISLNKFETKIKKTINSLYNYSGKETVHSFFGFNFKYPFSIGDIDESFEQKKSEINEQISQKSLNVVKELYKQIDPKTHNLIIAHSQGNLFANEICLYNKNHKKMEVLSVATPAWTVRCGTKYMTYKEDLVISSLSLLLQN